MASIPAQEEVLAATRKSQEAMVAAVKNWLEAVRTVTPKVTSVYSPLTDRLPKLAPVSLPFADKLPTPQDAVSNAYNMAEELLASQRKFAEELLKAMMPLMPGRGAVASKSNGSSKPKTAATASTEPKVPAHRTAKSTPARPAPRTTTAKRTAANSGTGTSTAAKSTSAKSTGAKSTGAKSGAGTSAAKRTTGNRAPKGTDAS